MAKTKSPSGSKRKDETLASTAALPPVAEKAEPTAALKTEPLKTEPLKTEPAKTNGSREPARLSVVKNDPRATVMPINLEEEIRRRAYELSERRGFTSGHEADDWLMAESEVLQRYHQHSA